MNTPVVSFPTRPAEAEFLGQDVDEWAEANPLHDPADDEAVADARGCTATRWSRCGIRHRHFPIECLCESQGS